MKKSIVIYFSILLTALFITSCQPTPDVEQEKEAIIKLIEEEKAAYLNGDISMVEATWIQEPTSRKYYMYEAGIKKLIGWNEIAAFDNPYIEKAPDWKDTKVEYLKFKITVYGNTALVFHDSHWTGSREGEVLDVFQTRILHLIKVDGEWKLDLMAVYRIPDEEAQEEQETETD